MRHSVAPNNLSHLSQAKTKLFYINLHIKSYKTPVTPVTPVTKATSRDQVLLQHPTYEQNLLIV